MPKYKITIWREKIVAEEVERIIDAPDEDSALERAREEAQSLNDGGPPDGLYELDDVEFRRWQVQDSADLVDDDEPADIVVEPADDEEID